MRHRMAAVVLAAWAFGLSNGFAEELRKAPGATPSPLDEPGVAPPGAASLPVTLQAKDDSVAALAQRLQEQIRMPVRADPDAGGERVSVEASGVPLARLLSDLRKDFRIRHRWSPGPALLLYRPATISMKLAGASMADGIKMVAQLSGRNILVAEGVAGTMTFNAKDLDWDECLDRMAREHGLQVLHREGGRILVVRKAEPIRPGRARCGLWVSAAKGAVGEAPAGAMSLPVTLQAKDEPAPEVAKKIQAQINVPVDVDRWLRDDRISVEAEKAPLAAVLADLLEKERVQHEWTADGRLRLFRVPTVSMNFAGAPLPEVLKLVSQLAGENLFAAPGLEKTLVTLNVRNATVDDFLWALSEAYGLDIIRRGEGKIMVARKAPAVEWLDRARAALEAVTAKGLDADKRSKAEAACKAAEEAERAAADKAAAARRDYLLALGKPEALEAEISIAGRALADARRAQEQAGIDLLQSLRGILPPESMAAFLAAFESAGEPKKEPK
ncbi:MAG: hypothetical protein AAB215_07715 [Planctomycetota bacterium]